MSSPSTGTDSSRSGPATDAAGHLTGIWVAAHGGARMQRADAAVVEPGVGIAGDRYATGRGHWSGQGDCEVTLIAAEALDALAERGVDLRAGAHRRNLETRGVSLEQLTGRHFTIGSARFHFERVRPPCRYLEFLTGVPGLRDALAGGRAGICARVVRAGRIRTGDPVVIEPR